MNNIQVNSIDNIGFSNPNSNPTWNQVDGDKEGIYYGQLDPDWKEKAQKIIDEQMATMKRLEDSQNKKSLPTEILIFGGGALVLLTVLVIYKYVKK
jgi:hypothetical protein